MVIGAESPGEHGKDWAPGSALRRSDSGAVVGGAGVLPRRMVDLECAGCRYGISIVGEQPPRCPIWGAVDWQATRRVVGERRAWDGAFA